MMTEQVKQALQFLAIPEKVTVYQRFFKTGKGEYAEGDLFIGVTVPEQRKVAKEFYKKVSLEDVGKLISSPIHEHRHTALAMLVYKFEKAKEALEKEQLVGFYLTNTRFINNWDLVDLSCYKILGRYCYEIGNDEILKKLSDSNNMWEKRMGIVGSMYHVKKGKYELTKTLALNNLDHPHDLMHKANGWLLREIGKKNEDKLLVFLKKHYHKMPRTSLRYAIEKLHENVRQDFLKGRM